MSDVRDVFICHASVDKELVVYPLVELLQARGISYWLDEAEIRWGDSIAQRINEGLRASRLAIVVLSANFVERNWPQREFYSALGLEASSATVRVLPLLAGPAEHRLELLERYPLLSGKRYLRWPEDRQEVASEILRRLGAERDSSEPRPSSAPKRFDIPIPQLRTKPTQLDRDRFAQQGFETVRAYFAEALQDLGAASPTVQATLFEVHARKFVAKVYIEGELKAECKIWLGGPFSGLQISYSEDTREVDREPSYNDWLSLQADNLAWDAAVPMFGGEPGSFDNVGAAAYLWKRFVERLR